MEEERTYLWPGYLIITTLVLLALFFTIGKLADETSFNQKYLTKDLTLLEETMFVSPGEVSLNYSILQEAERLEIKFDQNCLVEVNVQGSPELSGSRNYCANNEYIDISYAPTGDYDFLIFNKSQGNLFIDGRKING